MTSDRSVTVLANPNPASPAPSLPPRGLNPASAQTPRPGFVPPITAAPPAPPPLRHCAGQQKAARQLAACRRLPCRVLHHARGCATGFVFPAIAVPPAPTFALGRLGCVLPAACAVSFAHGSVGYLKPGLLTTLNCTQAAPG